MHYANLGHSQGTRRNAETGEVYFTPRFDQGLAHATNANLCEHVAEMVWGQVKVSLTNLLKIVLTHYCIH